MESTELVGLAPEQFRIKIAKTKSRRDLLDSEGVLCYQLRDPPSAQKIFADEPA